MDLLDVCKKVKKYIELDKSSRLNDRGKILDLLNEAISSNSESNSDSNQFNSDRNECDHNFMSINHNSIQCKKCGIVIQN